MFLFKIHLAWLWSNSWMGYVSYFMQFLVILTHRSGVNSWVDSVTALQNEGKEKWIISSARLWLAKEDQADGPVSATCPEVGS